MVKIPNKIATGLESIGEQPGIEVPRGTLEKMQKWVEEREYDDSDMLDIHRTKEFGEYIVDRERHHGSEDDVTVMTEDRLSSLLLSDFLEL